MVLFEQYWGTQNRVKVRLSVSLLHFIQNQSWTVFYPYLSMLQIRHWSFPALNKRSCFNLHDSVDRDVQNTEDLKVLFTISVAITKNLKILLHWYGHLTQSDSSDRYDFSRKTSQIFAKFVNIFLPWVWSGNVYISDYTWIAETISNLWLVAEIHSKK